MEIHKTSMVISIRAANGIDFMVQNVQAQLLVISCKIKCSASNKRNRERELMSTIAISGRTKTN